MEQGQQCADPLQSKEVLDSQVSAHIAGRISKYIKYWQELTSDTYILDIVRGYKIEFSEIPYQTRARPTVACKRDSEIIEDLILSFEKKGIIRKANHCDDQFISTVFTVPKSDGSFRLILNLKDLNEFVVYKHFKMEHFQSVLNIMTQNCYMAKIDLKDAYYTVNVHHEFRKFMRFIWKGNVMEYTCLAMGLSSAPRVFTKLLKPVFASLRSKGFISVVYIDDVYLQGSTFKECADNVFYTCDLLKKLGFIIHEEKSIFKPTQSFAFLGFEINSVEMTISLTDKKIATLRQKIKFIQQNSYTIRNISELLGLLTAYSVAIPYGMLFSKTIEIEKIEALSKSFGNFDSPMKLSEGAYYDMMWFYDTVLNTCAPIRRINPQIELFTDASLSGWGAVLRDSKTGGNWTESEVAYAPNINYLELYAVFLGLKSFLSILCGKHIKIHIDNSTAVACINHFGSTRSSKCNDITRKIWLLAKANDIWISAAYLPGKDNIEADFESRKIRDDTEWMLNSNIFDALCKRLFFPSVDLFASRINTQLKNYVSWNPDPGSLAFDAFTINWQQFSTIYAFPPFSIIDRVLQKIKQDRAEGILIVPCWETQLWFPVLMRMCVAPPIKIPNSSKTLKLPNRLSAIHSLHNKLHLLACHVSGNYTRDAVYQRNQFQSL